MNLPLARYLAAVPVAALLIAAPAVASADAHDTGPGSGQCAQANLRVEAAAQVAVDATDTLTDTQDQIAAALQVEVDAAVAEQTGLLAGFPGSTTLDQLTDAALRVTAALDAVASAANLTGPLAQALLDAQAVLDVEITARDLACTAPVYDDVVTGPVAGAGCVVDDLGGRFELDTSTADPEDLVCVADPPSPVGDDIDCADLTEEQAREILGADPRDPSRLDTDGDGVPCEEGELPDLDFDDLSGDGEDFSQLGGRARVPSGSVATGA